MATNNAANFSGDIESYIARKTLPLARKQLCAYKFGDPLELDKGRGTTYTGTRYNRLPLPQAPLSEGVPPNGEQMSISQVSATVQQWGDLVSISDIGELTVKHPLVVEARKVIALQMGETVERNTFNALLAGTQVNFVNSRGARASLVAGDVIDPHTVNRTVAALETLGAPRYMGDEETNTQIDPEASADKASQDPRLHPHYVVLVHTLCVGDFSENPTVVNAWSYSDVNRLYNYEAGEWRGTRWCKTNMVPTFTGVAQVNPTASAAGGSLATNSYFIIVTGSDTQNQYESRVYQVSNTTSVTGPTGSLSVTMPSTAGFTYNVYVGTTNAPTTLGLCASGPTSGPLQGQAVQLAPSAVVTITGIGTAQTPPAAPATGVTVFPTFVLGRGAYGIVKLDDVKITALLKADKSDPLNQLRKIGWKCMYGTLIQNQTFFARIESSSAFTSTFG